MTGKQIVRWPEVLPIDPKVHEFAPFQNSAYGAVTLVDGQCEEQGLCEIGAVYPTLLETRSDQFQCIGHYKAICWKVVPLNVWNNWPKPKRDNIVKGFHSVWGADVLLRNGHRLVDEGQGSPQDQINSFFDRDYKPHLRMTWAILKFHDFDQEDYTKLVAKTLKQTKKLALIAQSSVEIAFDTWRAPYSSGIESFRLDTVAQRQQLSRDVQNLGEQRDMFGKCYKKDPPRAHCEFFIKTLVLRLRDKFTPRALDSESLVVQIFVLIANVFEELNKAELQSKKANDSHQIPHSRVNSPSLTRPNFPEPPRSKRQRPGEKSYPNTPKRPRLDTPAFMEPRGQNLVASENQYSLSVSNIAPLSRSTSSNARSVNDTSARLLNPQFLHSRITKHWTTPQALS